MTFRFRGTLFVLFLALVPLSVGQGQVIDEGASQSAAAYLDEAQRRDIRVQLDDALVKLDRSEARAAAEHEPLVANFIALTRQYLAMIRLAILGEDADGNPGSLPTRAEMIALFDRTDAEIAVFRERYAGHPEIEPLMPRVEAMSRQLGDARRRMALEMAMEGSTMPLNANADAVFEKAQAQLDLAGRQIRGADNEAELRARLDELQARLDRARDEVAGGPVLHD